MFDGQYINIITYVFIVLFILSSMINIVVIYAKYIIVIENKNVYKSLAKSMKLTVVTFATTLKLYLLLCLTFKATGL